MTRFRIAALAITASTFVAVALIGQDTPATTPGRMQAAAEKFLGSLSPDAKATATFGFDDPHRLKWYFTPQQTNDRKSTRKGLRLDAMTAPQKAAAMELLKSGLSAKGYEQATNIIALEGLLAELEGGKGRMVRDTGWYFVSVFGEPTATGKWGWRFEGHHLSVNYTLDKGQVISATPVLFAANPADVKSGAKKGLRTLPEIEDQARALISSLNDEQKKAAEQPAQQSEIKEGQARAEVGPPKGVTADKLTAEQQETLMKLLKAYTDRMPEDLAAAEQTRAANTPKDKLYFAYWGSTKPGERYTYKVYAPEFVVEFLNEQSDSAGNPANHIHSAWRRLPADLGVSQ